MNKSILVVLYTIQIVVDALLFLYCSYYPGIIHLQKYKETGSFEPRERGGSSRGPSVSSQMDIDPPIPKPTATKSDKQSSDENCKHKRDSFSKCL